jgi:Domain of unknown function (DUF4352)
MSQPSGPQQPGPQPGFDNRRDARAQASAEKAYRKAQRPWYKKKRFILAILIVVIIVIIVSSNSGKSGSSGATVVSPGGQAAPAAPAQSSDAPPAFPGATKNDTIAKAGDAVNKDDLVLTTTALKAGDSTFGKSLCSRMTYQNNKKDAVSFNAFDWKLQDPNGAILTTTIGGSSNLLNSGDLAPGGKVSGDVCFDNKSGASGQYVLLYQGNVFSGDRIAWLNKF